MIEQVLTLKRTAALCLMGAFCSLNAQAQNIHVKGNLVDGTGEPLIGATVKVKGNANLGTITDFDGNFNIDVPSENSTLVITYVGMKTKEVKVGKKRTFNLALEDDNAIGEVVVVGYGQQKKASVVGSITQTTGKALERAGGVSSIGAALTGNLPGVITMSSTGMPGEEDPKIVIRGISSWNNSDPLVLVDGVERPMSSIDISSVQTISVLKDASATAVYGVKGANGVILITTKRGQEGPAHIEAGVNMTMKKVSQLPGTMGSADALYYRNQAIEHELGVTPESWGSITPAGIIEKYRNPGDEYERYPNVDWQKELFRDTGYAYNPHVNISGGTERMRYFVSVGAFTQNGLFKQQALPYDFNFKYKRFNYRANLDFDVTKTTTISVNLGGRVDTKNTPYSGEDNNQLFRHLYWATPFSSPGIVDGKYVLAGQDYKDCGNMPFTGASGLGAYYGLGYMSKNTNTLNADLVLNQKLDFITKGLSFKLKGSYNSDYSVTKQRASTAASYTPILQSDGTIEYRKSGVDSQLGYSEGFGKGRNWYFETSLNYSRNFGLHHVGGLVLYNQSKTYYPAKYTSIPAGYVGLVGRATYDWNNRYMAEFNVGYNGSENFAKNNRYGFFPAGSVGWIVSEEPFFKSLRKVVDYLKIRASWGLVGNDKISSTNDRFMYTDDPYGFGKGYNFGVNTGNFASGTYESSKHNPDVTWEKSFKQDYGVDLNILNNLSFAYFYQCFCSISLFLCSFSFIFKQISVFINPCFFLNILQK